MRIKTCGVTDDGMMIRIMMFSMMMMTWKLVVMVMLLMTKMMDMRMVTGPVIQRWC